MYATATNQMVIGNEKEPTGSSRTNHANAFKHCSMLTTSASENYVGTRLMFETSVLRYLGEVERTTSARQCVDLLRIGITGDWSSPCAQHPR